MRRRPAGWVPGAHFSLAPATSGPRRIPHSRRQCGSSAGQPPATATPGNPRRPPGACRTGNIPPARHEQRQRRRTTHRAWLALRCLRVATVEFHRPGGAARSHGMPCEPRVLACPRRDFRLFRRARTGCGPRDTLCPCPPPPSSVRLARAASAIASAATGPSPGRPRSCATPAPPAVACGAGGRPAAPALPCAARAGSRPTIASSAAARSGVDRGACGAVASASSSLFRPRRPSLPGPAGFFTRDRASCLWTRCRPWRRGRPVARGHGAVRWGA